MSEFVKVPYIVVRDNLDYSFSFRNKTHYVPQKNHGCGTHSSVIEYAKQHAEKVYFKHYMNKKMLPYITITKEGNGYEWYFYLGDVCHRGFENKDKNETFSIAINRLLTIMNIGGVS